MANPLIEEFEEWLDEHAARDVSAFVSHAETFLDWWGDAPLPTLDEEAVHAFLLDWCPRHLSIPADESWEVCAALVEFILFLGGTRRLGSGDARARRLARAANVQVDAMRSRMADPSSYGLAKSLFSSIEGAESMSEQELRTAMQHRIDEHNALPFEECKAVTDHIFGQWPDTAELTVMHVPPSDAEVAASVGAAALPAKVQALRDYLGDAGKALTPKSNLKLADGRALVELLDTGDEIDPQIGDRVFKTHSTETLRRLTYLLTLAAEVGAVRYVNNRLVPVKAWSRKTPIDKATRLFQVVIQSGVLSTTRRGIAFYGRLHALIDDGVTHWLAGLLAPGRQLSFDDIVSVNASVVRSQFDVEDIDYYIAGEHLAEDLSHVLEMLEMTGAVEWIDREESPTRFGHRVWQGGTVAVTAFGRHALPKILPAAEITLRTVDDLSEVDLTRLVEEMGSQPPEQHSTMLTAWKPSLSASERAGLIAEMITEASDATTRLFSLRLLGMFEVEVAEPYMRQLLDTAAAGHAAIWLLDHGLTDGDTVGGFITPAIMVDILSQLLEHPALLCEQFLGGHAPERTLEFFWRHPAPETAPVLDTLGRHLPDPALAKQARKAAIKHRSWIANERRE